MVGLNIFPKQSGKLKEICKLAADNLIPFYTDICSAGNARYRYSISILHFNGAYRFPVFVAESSMTSSFQTAIRDEETREIVAVPLSGLIQLRVKGPRAGSAVQGTISAGSIEVSDIRRVDILRPVPDPMSSRIVLVCFFDQDDIRKSMRTRQRR